MANYVRKTKDVWIIEENWGYGWEEACSHESKHEANENMKRYREDIRIRLAKGHETYQVRLRKRREKIDGSADVQA